MKYGIFIVAFVSLTAGAQTYTNNPFTNEAAALQAQARVGVGAATPVHTATTASSARVVTQVLTPQGNYVVVPNYATGGTMAVIQVSRAARGK